MTWIPTPTELLLALPATLLGWAWLVLMMGAP